VEFSGNVELSIIETFGLSSEIFAEKSSDF
jgi:hypothetical protein